MPDIKYAISTTRWRPRSGHARAKGISLEAEVRRTLAASAAADRAELVRRARALHAAAGGQPGEPELDSARLVRAERDGWGCAES
jgi:hypothetical protein